MMRDTEAGVRSHMMAVRKHPWSLGGAITTAVARGSSSLSLCSKFPHNLPKQPHKLGTNVCMQGLQRLFYIKLDNRM